MSAYETFATLFVVLGEIPVRLASLEREIRQASDRLASIESRLPSALASISDAARICGVSVPTMRRWVKAGEVPVTKVGNTVRVDVSRLQGRDKEDIASLVKDAA